MEMQQIAHQPVFLLIAYHMSHAWQGARRFRIQRRPATGDDNFPRRYPCSLTDFLTRIGCRRGSNRAGIYHDIVGFRCTVDDGMPGCAELPGELLNFALVQATAD
jgi:hypothetical protein